MSQKDDGDLNMKQNPKLDLKQTIEIGSQGSTNKYSEDNTFRIEEEQIREFRLQRKQTILENDDVWEPKNSKFFDWIIVRTSEKTVEYFSIRDDQNYHRERTRFLQNRKQNQKLVEYEVIQGPTAQEYSHNKILKKIEKSSKKGSRTFLKKNRKKIDFKEKIDFEEEFNQKDYFTMEKNLSNFDDKSINSDLSLNLPDNTSENKFKAESIRIMVKYRMRRLKQKFMSTNANEKDWAELFNEVNNESVNFRMNWNDIVDKFRNEKEVVRSINMNTDNILQKAKKMTKKQKNNIKNTDRVKYFFMRKKKTNE